MAEHPHIQFGEHSLPIYEQAPMRIIRRIGKLRDAFVGAVDDAGEFDPETLFSGLGERVYYLFVTFIPNLPERMPEYEFWGYPSRDAYDSGAFDEDRDGEKAAKFTQWLDAFDVIVQVHGGKRFTDLLGKVLPAEILRAEIGLAFSEWRESRQIGSPNSLSTNDGSTDQTSSGMTGPGSGERATEAPALANGSAKRTSSGNPLAIPA